MSDYNLGLEISGQLGAEETFADTFWNEMEDGGARSGGEALYAARWDWIDNSDYLPTIIVSQQEQSRIVLGVKEPEKALVYQHAPSTIQQSKSLTLPEIQELLPSSTINFPVASQEQRMGSVRSSSVGSTDQKQSGARGTVSSTPSSLMDYQNQLSKKRKPETQLSNARVLKAAKLGFPQPEAAVSNLLALPSANIISKKRKPETHLSNAHVPKAAKLGFPDPEAAVSNPLPLPSANTITTPSYPHPTAKKTPNFAVFTYKNLPSINLMHPVVPHTHSNNLRSGLTLQPGTPASRNSPMIPSPTAATPPQPASVTSWINIAVTPTAIGTSRTRTLNPLQPHSNHLASSPAQGRLDPVAKTPVPLLPHDYPPISLPRRASARLRSTTPVPKSIKQCRTPARKIPTRESTPIADTHEGNSPSISRLRFRCIVPGCDKDYSLKDSVRRHLRQHHPGVQWDSQLVQRV
ncbi:hypothetical protein RUND412_005704 [Rhizina undulata]